MDVSGGSGQPRSGNDEPTQHPAGPTAPATDPSGGSEPQGSPPSDTAAQDTKGRPPKTPAAPNRPPAPSDSNDAPRPTTDTPNDTDAAPEPGRPPADPRPTDADAPGDAQESTEAGREPGRPPTGPQPTGADAPGDVQVSTDASPEPGRPPADPQPTSADASGDAQEATGADGDGATDAAAEPGTSGARSDAGGPDTGGTAGRADTAGAAGTTGSEATPGTSGAPGGTGVTNGPASEGPVAGRQDTGTAGDTRGTEPQPPGAGGPTRDTTDTGSATPPEDAPSHPTGPEDAGSPGAGREARHEHRALAHSGIAKGEPPQPRPKEPGGGILMGRPFGVPVYVAPSWFLVAALITWVFGGQLDRVLPGLGAARYLVSLFFAVAFYASVLVHELAHTVAAIRFKLPVRRIQLQFFGGVSEIEKEAETPGREFVLAFVGPLLSLVLAGVFYLAMKPVQPGTVPGVLLAGLMISNLIVAIFNLLPGLPLDGGRMLRAVVWKITGKPMSGTVAAAWVGRALAVAVLIGLPLLNQSGALGGNNEDVGGMDTVTDALLAAILAAIIWTGAGNSLRMARLREHLPELRARTLTRRAVPVQTDTPLSEALRRANAAGARALVVVDAHGNPLSLVRESAIVGVPEHRRPWVAVSGLAQDLTDGMRVSAELAGEELLDVLRATPATEYLVVEETGEIYGVLSAADVERAFVRAMARPAV
ncbi:site-2 protease family protein [Streptomyces sp. NPDC048191]|uniref:site-2 protease family protein n=2 Tax=Streptomyces TaxID=1883 RepID=UPI0033E16907